MTPSLRQNLKKGTHRISSVCLMWGEEIELLAKFGVDKTLLRLRSIFPCGSLTRLGGVSATSEASNQGWEERSTTAVIRYFYLFFNSIFN